MGRIDRPSEDKKGNPSKKRNQSKSGRIDDSNPQRANKGVKDACQSRRIALFFLLFIYLYRFSFRVSKTIDTPPVRPSHATHFNLNFNTRQSLARSKSGRGAELRTGYRDTHAVHVQPCTVHSLFRIDTVALTTTPAATVAQYRGLIISPSIRRAPESSQRGKHTVSIIKRHLITRRAFNAITPFP